MSEQMQIGQLNVKNNGGFIMSKVLVLLLLVAFLPIVAMTYLVVGLYVCHVLTYHGLAWDGMSLGTLCEFPEDGAELWLLRFIVAIFMISIPWGIGSVIWKILFICGMSKLPDRASEE